MSFEEIMRRILPKITRNGIEYIAYINGRGNVSYEGTPQEF